MEMMNNVLFYCLKCDHAPVESFVDKTNFYRCKECKSLLAAIKQDRYER